MAKDTAAGSGRRHGDSRVDMWLRASLANRFDTVLSEQLPDDWLRLIGAAVPGGRDR